MQLGSDLACDSLARTALAFVLALMHNAICSPHLHKGQYRKSLLQTAVQAGSKKIMKTLVHRGADVNYADADGNTALHYAYNTTREGADKMREYLEKKGADQEAKNSGGKSPKDGLSRKDDD